MGITGSEGVDIDTLDLMDPGLFARGELDQAFAYLRAHHPVFWTREPDGPGFWSLTRHRDMVSLLKDRGSFTSERGMLLGVDRTVGDPAAGKMLVVTDPPRHAGLRRNMIAGLTPVTIGRLENSVRTTVTALMDRAVAAGRCDLVGDFAARLPCAVVSDLIGVPSKDWDLMYQLTSLAFGADDPDIAGKDSAVRARARAHTALLVYYHDLLQARRKEPRDDIISALSQAEVDGAPLTDEEIMLNCDNLVIGGNETTRQAISGGILAFVEHPDQLARLRAEPALMDTAVEEILRWTSPAMHTLRCATRDTEIGGRPIKAGDAVVAWLPAANRDPEIFRDPDVFDISRSPNRHLTFGGGHHFCLGNSLAKLELRAVLEALLGQVTHLELAGPPQRLKSLSIRGIKRMPARIQGRVVGPDPRPLSA